MAGAGAYRSPVPDLRQLRTFLALAEELNFTRAGERLHVGQQAVSKTINQLEAQLGVELVERTTREVRLTAAGQALLEAGRPALAAVDAAFHAAREAGRGLAGTVRIGASPSVGSAERGEAVAALRADAPDLSVSVHEVRPAEVRRALRDRQLDLVLARTVRESVDLETAALRPTPAVLHVPAGHRLAGRGTASLRELDGERLLVRSAPGTPYTDLIIDRIAAAGARVEAVVSRFTGAGAPSELADLEAVTLVPAGLPPDEGTVEVAIEAEEEVTLPLLVIWPVGPEPAAVRRVRAAMTS